MIQYKIRIITKNIQGNVYGITIPREVALFFSGCFFTITKQKDEIKMSSGCMFDPTEEEISHYDLEDFKI